MNKAKETALKRALFPLISLLAAGGVLFILSRQGLVWDLISKIRYTLHN